MLYSVTFDGDVAIYRDEVEKQALHLPAVNVIGLAEAGNPPPITDTDSFRLSVHSPSTGRPLRDIARKKGARSACIIVSDATRGVPTRLVAQHIADALESAGIPPENIVFIVALGVHRPATASEMEAFIGPSLCKRYRIINHNAFSDEELVSIGKSSFGTEIRVNKTAFYCDMHIVIGKVELHEFAGFSGGRKSVLPGICAESTILANHSPRMIVSPNSRAGVLEGNPIHIEMAEAANLFGIDFCINFVVNNEGLPAAVFSGEPASSHALAVEYVRSFCSVSLAERPDIIVTTCGSPLNCDLYQALKALFALTGIIDEHMAVILYAACPEGVNSPDMMRPFQRFESFDEIDDYVLSNYKIQMDHTLPLTRTLRKCQRIFICSPGVPDSDIRTLRLKPCDSLSAAVKSAMSSLPVKNPRILFFPQPQKALISYRE